MTRRTKNGTSRVCHDPTIIAVDSLGDLAMSAGLRDGREEDDYRSERYV
jgi:hypothetical protein